MINPTRPDIGKISKIILERITNQIKKRLGLKLWINTKEVINWFTNIDNKPDCTLIQFDIVDYYQSISKDLFTTALEIAAVYSDLTKEETNIILSAKKSVLIHNEEQWIKNTADNFDISMGYLDSAESSDLVGLFMLYNLTAHRELDIEDIGLYRDDGLMVVRSSTNFKTDKIRKIIYSEFGKIDLKTIVNTKLKRVNFLDVTLDLVNKNYTPYRKPNTNPLYVHPKSNHPQ